MKRIASRGLLTLSLVVVLLGATAGSASAAVTTLNPTSTAFGDREVGTSSPAQSFVLNHRCQTVSFGIPPILLEFNECDFFGILFPSSFSPSIATSGDFLSSEDCPITLTTTSLTGVSCNINVVFAPSSLGPKTGTLSTGIGGPTAALTGNGVNVPTPPTPPTPGPPPAPAPPPTNLATTPQPGQPALVLDLDAKKQGLKKKLTFFATCNVDCGLVAVGSIKQTTAGLSGGVKTKIKATLKPNKFKQLAQALNRTGKAKAKIEASATSPTSGTATDEIKVKLKG